MKGVEISNLHVSNADTQYKSLDCVTIFKWYEVNGEEIC